MGKFIISLFLIFNSSILFCQEDLDPQIEEAVHRFFEAMRTGDTATLVMILPSDCIMQTVEEEEGRVVVKAGDRDQFVSVVGKLGGKLDEQVDSLVILQDGPLATVWMNYEFYFDGEKHHCGVNAMTMAYREERWQVLYICDTRRDCL